MKKNKVILFGLILTNQLHAVTTCYEILKRRFEIARYFDENFLTKMRLPSKNPERNLLNTGNYDRSMFHYILNRVQEGGRFDVKEHALDTLFKSNPDPQDLINESVKLSHSKSQYIELSEENFFRLLPREIPKGPLLNELKKAVLEGRFNLRELRYSRRDNRSPELVGDTTLLINGNVFTFRFGIVIPLDPNALPILSLFSPRVNSQTDGNLICVYRSCHFQEHLVITDWERGSPKLGAVVETSSVLIKEKISRSIEELSNETRENGVFIERFLYRIRAMQESYDWKLVASGNHQLKSRVAQILAQNPEFRVSSLVRNQLSSYPFIGYRGGTSYEHGAVQHAQPVFSKINFQRDYTASFFPDNINRKEILDALRKNILEKRFEIQEEKLNSSGLFFALTHLRLQGEDYPVEFSFRMQEEEGSSLYLSMIHPFLTSAMSNHVVSVHIDLRMPKMFVVTQWREGLPIEGTFIQR
jgi:hypothetical protein